MIKSIKIEGFRGYSKSQTIHFAKPNGEKGSGITLVVGQNNSGKTTIGEVIMYHNADFEHIQISSDKRNLGFESTTFDYTYDDNSTFSVKTIPNSSHFAKPFEEKRQFGIYHVASRRSTEVTFHKNSHLDDFSRINYMQNKANNANSRFQVNNSFDARMNHWFQHKEAFNEILYKLLDTELKWTIDSNTGGQSFIKFIGGNHSIEGVGDGIWSLFVLVDALFDSEPNDLIFLDEPELSLHPNLQKKIMNLLLEYSKDRQIVISTHSPYFIVPEIIEEGYIVRVVNKKGETNVYCREYSHINSNVFASTSQPHAFGLDAREAFFTEDSLILVEGQEDVICYKNILKSMEINPDRYNFYGWGVSGHGNMDVFCSMFEKLGYQNVVVLLDGDPEAVKTGRRIEEKFPKYSVFHISTTDIRDKKVIREDGVFSIVGICGPNYRIKKDFEDTYKEEIFKIFESIDRYFE